MTLRIARPPPPRSVRVVGAPNRRQSVAAAIAREAERIVAAFLKAGLEQGDWRALEALVTRHLGKPQERVEVETEGVNLRELSDLGLQALKRKLTRSTA